MSHKGKFEIRNNFEEDSDWGALTEEWGQETAEGTEQVQNADTKLRRWGAPRFLLRSPGLQQCFTGKPGPFGGQLICFATVPEVLFARFTTVLRKLDRSGSIAIAALKGGDFSKIFTIRPSAR